MMKDVKSTHRLAAEFIEVCEIKKNNYTCMPIMKAVQVIREKLDEHLEAQSIATDEKRRERILISVLAQIKMDSVYY